MAVNKKNVLLFRSTLFIWRKCYVYFVVCLIIGFYLFAKYYYCSKVK